MDGSVGQDGLEAADQSASIKPASTPKKKARRLILMIAPPLVVAAIIGGWLVLTAGRVSTDNATISSARSPISASVRARVSEILVTENETVQAGDVLLRLDPGDFEIAVSQAKARLASARLQVDALRASYGKALADVRTARTQSGFADKELERQKNLFDAGIISRQQLDEAQNAANVASRNLAAAGESLSTALANLGGSPDLETDQHPLVLQAQAALEQAQSDQADTEIRAPASGTVTRVNQVQIGSYVQPAQTLFWLVSGQPWIDAAFKENQLENLRPGQPVEIHVDAFPGAKLHGHVGSFSPGTGSSFAVLPAENATGNWVRVVQRLNVHIDLDDPPADLPLAVGLSAKVTVDTRARAADAS